jgi:hypothetical protein
MVHDDDSSTFVDVTEKGIPMSDCCDTTDCCPTPEDKQGCCDTGCC